MLPGAERLQKDYTGNVSPLHSLMLEEDQSLAAYALRSSHSRGRQHAEPEDPYRTAFQRDRDRIVHSKAFRRLSGKTQVFISSYGDHYRSRMTHSLEVSQVSRDIARALRLNEDLCEAIALAHDLGHTPYGHAGEEAMSDMMVKFGGVFEHNEQSRRIVEVLEQKSPDYAGLNLTWEVREGLMKHRSLHDDKKTPVIHSLEAQIVDLSDAIAYHHHDLDDGLRSGVLQYESLAENVELWKQAMEDLSFTELGEDLYRHTCINRIMSLLINDVIEEMEEGIKRVNIQRPLDHSHHPQVANFSERMKPKVEQLADYLGDHFYLHERVSSQAFKGQQVIKKLFKLLIEKEQLLPQSSRNQLDTDPPQVVVKDYIAGMTDEYAMKLFAEYQDLV